MEIFFTPYGNANILTQLEKRSTMNWPAYHISGYHAASRTGLHLL